VPSSAEWMMEMSGVQIKGLMRWISVIVEVVFKVNENRLLSGFFKLASSFSFYGPVGIRSGCTSALG
jgi:hypothetical protein